MTRLKQDRRHALALCFAAAMLASAHLSAQTAADKAAKLAAELLGRKASAASGATHASPYKLIPIAKWTRGLPSSGHAISRSSFITAAPRNTPPPIPRSNG